MYNTPQPTARGRRKSLTSQLYELLDKGPNKEWRRSDSRIEIREAIEVEYNGDVLFGHTVNISSTGLCIFLRQTLEPRTEIKIRLTDHGSEWEPCRVTHCTQSLGGFKVGVHCD